MPGLLLQTVFSHAFESDASGDFDGKTSAEALQAFCGSERLADPRPMATWWADRLERSWSKRKAQTPGQWSEYLKQRPDIAERLHKRYEPDELIPWR